MTLGIGGNDIGFSGIIEDCATLPARSARRAATATWPNGVDELSRRIAATAPEGGGRAEGIRGRSPQARVLVSATRRSCPTPARVLAVDADRLQRRALPAGKEKELNAMLRRPGRGPRRHLRRRLHAEHRPRRLQAPTTRWVEPIVPGNAAAPVHPNARGMAGMAAAVTARLAA